MNCNTQNAKIASKTEKTLIVGIDVGSEHHYAKVFDWGATASVNSRKTEVDPIYRQSAVN